MDRQELDLGDLGRAEERVVRLINVHDEATSDDIRHFFRDLDIVDLMRDTDSRRKIKHVVYVLFSSFLAKDRALNLDGQYVHGRRVAILPARSGYRIKEDQSGFVRAEEKSSIPAPTMQVLLPAPSLGESKLPRLGSPVPPPVREGTTPRHNSAAERQRRNRNSIIPEKSEKCVVRLRSDKSAKSDYDLVLWLQTFLPRAIHRSRNTIWMLFCRERDCKNLAFFWGRKTSESEERLVEWPTTVPADVLADLYKSPRDLTENLYMPDMQHYTPYGPLPLTGEEWELRKPAEMEIGNTLWNRSSKTDNSGTTPSMSPIDNDDDDDGDVPLSVLFSTTNKNTRQHQDQPSNITKNKEHTAENTQGKSKPTAPGKDSKNIYDKASHTFGTLEERQEGHRKYQDEGAVHHDYRRAHEEARKTLTESKAEYVGCPAPEVGDENDKLWLDEVQVRHTW